jgi:N-acyl-D-amino-acid deacylase
MADPRVMIGSDSVAASPTGPTSDDRPHPRSYGTFARVLSRYVRERGLLTWEEAVRRMTSLPAERLGWTDRGRIASGGIADLVILDPNAIADTATFSAPHSLAIGVEHVIVAGTIAFAGGAPTGTRSGKILRRRGA